MSNDKVISLEQEIDKRTIFRRAHNRENPYAQISKKILRDNRLSAKAMGLMCYFLSLPDDWEISTIELVKHFSDGEKSIRAGIKELALIGYIEIQQSRESKGRFSSTTFLIHEEPIQNHQTLEPRTFSPYAQKRHAVNRHAENGVLLNTDNTKDRITKDNNKDVVSNKNESEFKSNSFVVVSLVERVKHLAISRVLVTSWLKKYGLQYILEKIELTETQKPHSPECFLNKAIAQDWKPALTRQLESKQESPSDPVYPSHNENIVWYKSLADEDKLKYLQMASCKSYILEEHLKYHKVSVLDADFFDHSLFKMMMSLLGRVK